MRAYTKFYELREVNAHPDTVRYGNQLVVLGNTASWMRSRNQLFFNHGFVYCYIYGELQSFGLVPTNWIETQELEHSLKAEISGIPR